MSVVERAVGILRAGGLVAFPTETVYGLGADATSAAAVARVFAAKGRPTTNPLIVHVADAATARRYAAVWPEQADRLAEAFWPGPLTIVLPKVPAIPSSVTAGLGNVGLRAPDHPLALELLRAFAGPLAAPSANRSNRISPTTAEHVRDELGDAVDLILDGGPCRVGVESTVLDLTGSPPRILRPGGISADELRRVIGEVLDAPADTSPDAPALSPGRQPVHYSPTTLAYRVEANEVRRLREWLLARPADPVALLVRDGDESLSDLPLPPTSHVRRLPADPAGYARGLYAALRELDRLHAAAILVLLPPPTPPWAAVRDRLLRATRPLP